MTYILTNQNKTNTMARNSYKPMSNHYILFFCLSALACYCYGMPKNAGAPQGMFIFGSSVVDNGNNNNLAGTLAKANYSPYGVDFASGPTGRFSNGKNVADFIAEHLKLPPIPAFNDPQTKGPAITHGVNFGSGGSGILDDTGRIAVKVITLNEQIANFETVTLPQLEAQLGSKREEILPNFLFLLAAGNNDYLLNYFLAPTLTPQAFAEKLTSAYSDQLKRLYNLGARNFLLLSVYPLGCSPVVSKGLGCAPGPNAVVTTFYNQLISMVNQIKPQMPGSEFVVVNSVKIITDIINNAASAGFTNANGPCCQLSLNGASCQENGKVCDDRKAYVYFDGQHNTEALNAILATKVYNSQDQTEVHPVNLHRLAHTRFNSRPYY